MNEEFNDLIGIINDYLKKLNPEFDNEEEFKNELAHRLDDEYGWQWETEKRFLTNRLANEQEISYDLFGVKNNKAFIIELKHVICNEQGIPNNPPAFPYDVLKDCVKIELAIGRNLAECNEFEEIYGISIGLSNFTKYWDQEYQAANWASNYIEKIKPNNIIDTTGIIRTNVNEGNEFTRIYRNRRCHISLGLKWNGEWRGTEKNNWKYLILTTDDKNPEYQHDPESSDTIPFINENGKRNFLAKRNLRQIPSMAAKTAQLLLGNPHPNDGGLTVIDTLTLSEGDRPAWTMRRTGPLQEGWRREVVWIPSVEHMLDDGLLMAALYAFKCETVREKFLSFSDKLGSNRLEIYEDLSVEQRHELYRLCRGIEDFPRIELTVYHGSGLIPCIGTLAYYRMEYEVLMPVYSRSSSWFSRDMTVNVELPPVPEFIDYRK